MPRMKKRKTDRIRVTNETIKAALKCVIQDKVSIRTAAEMHYMKKSSLFRYIQKYKDVDLDDDFVEERKVPNKVFTAEHEKELSVYLLTASQMHHGLTTVETRKLAFQYGSALGLQMPENWISTEQAGVDWLFGFLKRNPTLSIRAPEATSLARSTSFNKTNVDKFYNNLSEVLTKHPYEPHRIFNCDETGCKTVHKPPNVIAKKGCKQVGQITSAERGQLVTVCCFISACGSIIPPAFVFPRATMSDHLLIDAPPGSLPLVHKSGWMTSEIFFKTMQHFVKHSNSSNVNKTLLILDNHESHISIDVIKYARDNGVTMLTFPPHCSHRLQPLDVSVYGPFKKRYDTSLNDWMLSNPGRTINYYQVPSLVNKAFKDTFTPKNILAGFAATGIYPFNRNIFSETDFLMSYVSDRPEPQLNVSGGENTPQPSTSTLYVEQPESATEKSKTLTPETVRPYPKAKPRTERITRRRKGRTRILTSTPEKDQLEAEQILKMKSIPKKNIFKSTITAKKIPTNINIIASSSDSDESVSLHDSSSDCFTENEIIYAQKNEYVLVQFMKKTRIVYYAGQVTDIIHETKEIQVNFLKRKSDSWLFFWPENKDEAWIDMTDVKLLLPVVTNENSTARFANSIRFAADLTNYIVE